MKRLTYRNNLGEAYLEHGADAVWSRCEAYDILKNAIDRLAAYEDMELTPEEFRESIDFSLELNKKAHRMLKAEEDDRVIVLPCKEGDTIYRIVKFCEENTGCQEFYRPSVEFESDCEYFEPACWFDDSERCNAEIEDDDKEPWHCSFNLDILCEKCKERFAIQKDIFTLSKVRQIFNTPMFNENISLEDIYYLSFEEAENALIKIIGY